MRLDELKIQLEKAEREVNLEKAAEIKYGLLPKIKNELKESEKLWKEIPDGKKLLKEEVGEEDIAQIVSKWTGIPLTKLLKNEAEKLINLEEELSKRVIGQDESIVKISKAIRRNRAGISDLRGTIGTFLFLGPTGVGKTETAKALAEFMMGTDEAIVRVDMSEFQEEHSQSRLIGSPPGYVGYEEGGQLTEAVRRRPYSVILLDEIEKAHSNIFNLLLQVFDDGRLTDGKGNLVDFKNTVIIMTSNLGSDIISENTKDKDTKIQRLLNLTFKPEFLNRLDSVVMYKPITKEVLKKIAEIQLVKVKNRFSERGINIEISDDVKIYLAEKGYDTVFGARPLMRLIEDKILDYIALQIIKNEITSGDSIKVTMKNKEVTIKTN